MRPDLNLSSLTLALDPATKAFAAVVEMDAKYSNPFAISAAQIFIEALADVRAARAKQRRAAAPAAAAPAAAAAGADAPKCLARLRAALRGRAHPANTQAVTPADPEGASVVVVSNPLSAAAAVRHDAGDDAAAAAPALPPSKDTDALIGDSQPKAAADTASAASQRARARWWLAVVLLANPKLREFRVRRGAQDAAPQESEGLCGELF
jgi:hypothetical protein